MLLFSDSLSEMMVRRVRKVKRGVRIRYRSSWGVMGKIIQLILIIKMERGGRKYG